MLLLQECWKDLFLLHLCQWSVAWDISHLLTARAASLSPGIETEVRAVLEIISRYLKQSLQNIQELHVVYQVPRHAARPDRVRLHEDHRPVQAGDGGPGRAAECGGAAGPGPVHPRRLRQEQIHQPADQVRSGERQFALLFFRLAELNKHSQTSFSRFGRLLLVIPLLRMVKATLVETLFFRETVGETNIKNIILGKMTK